jgi:nucleoside triphosphate diphosphatase
MDGARQLSDLGSATDEAEGSIARLVGLMAALRTPGTGCPWDLEQSFATIAPYTLEEAYEVVDAIDRGDLDDLKDELGDLLLQVVFHARMAEEAGAFALPDVAAAISAKLVRRHPHVFGDATAEDAAAVKTVWEDVKRAERAARSPDARRGALAGVTAALPALTRADKLSRKAAAVGFDWPDAAQVVAKVREETAEVEEALAGRGEALAEEIGDLLFSVANLARHAGIDPETALRRANTKFERRFGAMEERLLAEGRALAETPLEVMEAAWAAVKGEEKAALSASAGAGPGGSD